jgi:hypothetical protein
MSAPCCVKGCAEQASIRQPLKLGHDLVLHIPLCAAHSSSWEIFVERLKSARERAARENVADWMLDAALSLALFPP